MKCENISCNCRNKGGIKDVILQPFGHIEEQEEKVFFPTTLNSDVGPLFAKNI